MSYEHVLLLIVPVYGVTSVVPVRGTKDLGDVSLLEVLDLVKGLTI